MSKTPKTLTWREKNKAIHSGEAGREITPSAELRPRSKRIVQYLDPNDNELLVVRGRSPYGSLTEVSFEAHPRLHLLHGAERGKDFVAFDVGEDCLSLRGIAGGTGRQNAAQMEPILEDVRRAVFDIAGQAKVPALRIGDIAIDRIGGEVLFLPPLEFESGHSDPLTLIEGLAVSLGDELETVFPPDAITNLQGSLRGE